MKVDIYIITDNLGSGMGWTQWFSFKSRHAAIVFKTVQGLIRFEISFTGIFKKKFKFHESTPDVITASHMLNTGEAGTIITHLGSIVEENYESFVNNIREHCVKWLANAGSYSPFFNNCRSFINPIIRKVISFPTFIFKEPDFKHPWHSTKEFIKALKKNALDVISRCAGMGLKSVKELKEDPVLPQIEGADCSSQFSENDSNVSKNEEPLASHDINSEENKVPSDNKELISQKKEAEPRSTEQENKADSDLPQIEGGDCSSQLSGNDSNVSKNEEPLASHDVSDEENKVPSDNKYLVSQKKKPESSSTEKENQEVFSPREDQQTSRYLCAAFQGAMYGASYSAVRNWNKEITFYEYTRLIVLDVVKYAVASTACEAAAGPQAFLFLTAAKELYLDGQELRVSQKVSYASAIGRTGIRVACRLFGNSTLPLLAAKSLVMGAVDGYMRSDGDQDQVCLKR